MAIDASDHVPGVRKAHGQGLVRALSKHSLAAALYLSSCASPIERLSGHQEHDASAKRDNLQGALKRTGQNWSGILRHTLNGTEQKLLAGLADFY